MTISEIHYRDDGGKFIGRIYYDGEVWMFEPNDDQVSMTVEELEFILKELKEKQ